MTDHIRPDPAWYCYDNGRSIVPVLTVDGNPMPSMQTPAEQALASLAAAVHAQACYLSEAQLRHLEQFVAIQRWSR